MVLLSKRREPAMALKEFALDREVTHLHGRGVYAYYIIREANVRRGILPHLLTGKLTPAIRLDPLDALLLRPVFQHSAGVQERIETSSTPVHLEMPLLCSMANNLALDEVAAKVTARSRFGLAFFHNAHMSPQTKENAKRYHTIFSGSTWNHERLKASGINNVHLQLQGTEPSLFHPAPQARLFGDRFVVFAGGKLEYRKGQDIVIAAFRAFRQRHKDAILMTAWENLWPQHIYGMTANGHTTTEPVSADGTKLETVRWVLENGVPPESYVNLGLIFHTQTPAILREADVAVFPNRSEGGTNMVALECLACGVPTVLSANTGHLDLTDPAHCYPLTRQTPCKAPRDYLDVTDWGESSVDELVEILEALYTDRAEARRRSANAVAFMHARPWSKQIGAMLDVMAGG